LVHVPSSAAMILARTTGNK